MNKKQIFTLIAIGIISIIILILIKLINSNQIKGEMPKKNIINDEQPIIESQQNELYPESTNDYFEYEEELLEYPQILERVEERQYYFTISSLFNNYINLIGFDVKEKLGQVLSPQYINQYNVNAYNLLNKELIPETYNNKQIYTTRISEMLTTRIDNTTYIYIVKGKARIPEKENSTFDIEAMFEIDVQNKIYYIYPEVYLKDNGISNLRVGDTLNYVKEEIIDNQGNRFEYADSKQDKDMAKEYFYDYKELITYYPEEAYNKLDKEYAQKRFSGSIEKFKAYLKENKELFDLMKIEMYKVISKEEDIYYVCADQYDKVYMFKLADGLMNYTAFLDNYTVMASPDIETYNDYDKFDKAKYNLTKFINMVNTKDYAPLYNVLNETFRANNFKDIETLKKYLQTNMYELNTIEIENFDDRTYEYYVFECKLINLKDENEIKNITFIINQEENFDFSISFSFE